MSTKRSKPLTGTKGGSGVWQRIISEMPEHTVYIEPFWGRGTIAKHKRPAAHTIGCDVDPDALDDGRALGALMFRTCGRQWLRDYFRLQSAEDAGYRVTAGHATTFGGVSWSEHLVYLDPPYCGVPNYYRCPTWTEDDHRDVCRLFMALPCPAMLSGYPSDVYAAELGVSRTIKIPTTNRAGRRVVEWLWMNFDPPARYHDTRFLGVGRRQRERIRRRKKHWAAGLERMPAAERQAVLDAILDRT